MTIYTIIIVNRNIDRNKIKNIDNVIEDGIQDYYSNSNMAMMTGKMLLKFINSFMEICEL